MPMDQGGLFILYFFFLAGGGGGEGEYEDEGKRGSWVDMVVQ